MNIIICGVGGNGVILTTKILAEAAMKEGFEVRIGASHGLAIRGGTVVSYLRIGSDAKGVILPQRSGDILLAFEPLEALRQLKLLIWDSPIRYGQTKRTQELLEGKATSPQ